MITSTSDLQVCISSYITDQSVICQDNVVAGVSSQHTMEAGEASAAGRDMVLHGAHVEYTHTLDGHTHITPVPDIPEQSTCVSPSGTQAEPAQPSAGESAVGYVDRFPGLDHEDCDCLSASLNTRNVTNSLSVIPTVSRHRWYTYLRTPGAEQVRRIWYADTIKSITGCQRLLVNRACALGWSDPEIRELLQIWCRRRGLKDPEMIPEMIFLSRKHTQAYVDVYRQQQEAKAGAKTTRRIVDVLREMGTARLSDLYIRIQDVQPSAIRKACSRDARIERAGRGAYRLAPVQAAVPEIAEPAGDPDPLADAEAEIARQIVHELACSEFAFRRHRRADELADALFSIPTGSDYLGMRSYLVGLCARADCDLRAEVEFRLSCPDADSSDSIARIVARQTFDRCRHMNEFLSRFPICARSIPAPPATTWSREENLYSLSIAA